MSYLVQEFEFKGRCEQFLREIEQREFCGSFEFQVEWKTRYPTWAFDFFKLFSPYYFNQGETLNYKDLSMIYSHSERASYIDFLYKVIDLLIKEGKLAHYVPGSTRVWTPSPSSTLPSSRLGV